jgi:predicted DNA-binding antitoxin AbrB/MazE fold protein
VGKAQPVGVYWRVEESIMSVVDAVYANGAFRPIGPVDLLENQRVRLTVEKVDPVAVENWLAEMKVLRDYQLAKYGVFPDSTPDIAADRRRDV